jgi:hypothetical protein
MGICQLDTLAMVELYKALTQIASRSAPLGIALPLKCVIDSIVDEERRNPALGELRNKGIVVSIANQLDLKFGSFNSS